jgi:hypothetical protein
MEIMTEKDENSANFKYCHVEDMFTEVKNYFVWATIVHIVIAYFICILIEPYYPLYYHINSRS